MSGKGMMDIMKVLAVVCGRKNQFSERIGRIALKAAKEEGAKVRMVNLMDLKIEACINCGSCVRKMRDDSFNGRCPLCKDDMEWLDDQILSSDGVLFVAPMFEAQAPGVYRVMCDRMGPSHDVTFLKEAYEKRKSQGKDPQIDTRYFQDRAVAFIGHGGSEWSYMGYPTLATPAVSMGMKIVDYVRLDWNNGLMLEEGRLERIRSCGAHLAKMARLPAKEMTYIGPKGVCPACHCDVVRIDANNGNTECALCGVKGKLVGGQVVVDDEAVKISHIFDAGRKIHMDDLKQNARVRAGLDQEEIRRRTEPLQKEIPLSSPLKA